MNKRIYLVAITLFSCTSTLAAHIVTDTRSGSDLVKRTHMYANSAGDLRIDEHGFEVSASVSSDAAVGESPAKVEYKPGDIDDTTIFQAREQAILMLEGDTCRRMTADSPPPPGLGMGMGGADLSDVNKQMADAMKQASSAIELAMEQARKEGMTEDQERAMKQFTQPFTEAGEIKPRDALQIEKMNQRTRVGRYSAEGYRVTDTDGVEKHRVWVVDAGKVSGGAHVKNAMEGMVNVYEQYLDALGGRALMETSLTTFLFKDELAGTYPVRVEDIETGEVTDVVEASNGSAGVEYYPDCVVKDIFGQ